MEVDRLGGRLSDTLQWVLPDELLRHAYDDYRTAFCHSVRREAVWDLKDSKWTDSEFVSLEKERENLAVVILHMNLN